MAERDILLWPDPVLTQSCMKVHLHDSELVDLIDDLFDTMYAANGRGLAAPQIGVLKRVFVIDVTWKEGNKDPRVFLNPKLIAAGTRTEILDEQCLSIPDLPMPVSRPSHIQMRWSNVGGTTTSAAFSGILARCVLHEFDHLDGKLILDHQTPQERARLEAVYGS